MTTLKEGFGRPDREAGTGETASQPAQVRRARWQAAASSAQALVRRHWLFTLALAAAIILRAVAMLGYQPAMLFRLDTYDYLWGAVRVAPNLVNPSGYSLFLWVLRPFHSLALVAALQHVLGLGIATMVYALLRRYGLPAWGAVLAAAPVLFDPAQLLIEHLVMADLLAMVLMIAAFTVLLLRRPPSALACLAAGLMMGASVTVRPTTLPLVIFIPAYLLLSRFGWRKAGAALVAGGVPVLGYMSWFAAVHGPFNLSNSNGIFLWSRTMSFANCAVIKPPADLLALCPDRQPGRLAQPNPARRPLPKRYLWNHGSWLWQGTTSGFVPDAAAFTPANNQRALRFALKAIEAQPLNYASVVVQETIRPFEINNNLRFVSFQPRISTLSRDNRPYAVGAVEAYAGNTQGVTRYLGYDFGTRLHRPFSFAIQRYQHIIFLPGPVFAGIVLVGLGGLLLPRRRTGAAALLWLSALVIILLPTAEHEYTYRYDIPAVPLMCIAAALAFRRPAAAPATASAAGVPSPRAEPSPAGQPAIAGMSRAAQDGGAGEQPGAAGGAAQTSSAARSGSAARPGSAAQTSSAARPGSAAQTSSAAQTNPGGQPAPHGEPSPPGQAGAAG